MLKRRKINWLLIVLAVSLLASCKSIKQLNISEPQGFEIESSNVSGLDGKILVKATNPSMHKIKIVSMNLDISVNGQKLGKVRLAEKVIIPKKSDEVIKVPLQLRFLNPMTGAMMMFKLMKQPEVDVLIEGEVIGRAAGVKKKVPVKETQKINLRKYLGK